MVHDPISLLLPDHGVDHTDVYTDTYLRIDADMKGYDYLETRETSSVGWLERGSALYIRLVIDTAW